MELRAMHEPDAMQSDVPVLLAALRASVCGVLRRECAEPSPAPDAAAVVASLASVARVGEAGRNADFRMLVGEDIFGAVEVRA